MIYTACDVLEGTAHAADDAEVPRCDRIARTAKVLYPFCGPVQKHLDADPLWPT